MDNLFLMDTLLITADRALRTVFAHHHASRTNPAIGITDTSLSDAEKREASALMRVNHVGEVCAQALYTAQALATKSEGLRRHLQAACEEETDHLAWTEERLTQLGGRTSLLNPLWYAGAFGIGFLAAKLGGDPMSHSSHHPSRNPHQPFDWRGQLRRPRSLRLLGVSHFIRLHLRHDGA